MATTNVTSAQANAGLINTAGARWAGSSITYSVPGVGAVWAGGYGTNEPGDPQYGTLDATQAANFKVAIELWDSYIAPSLTEVSDATPGDIRIAFTDVTARQGANISAFAYGPSTGGVSPEAGDIWVDETLKSNPFTPRTSAFELLLHEAGHSLGLKHPFESPTLPAGYDTKTYSIMSYTAEDNFYTFSGGGGSIFVNYSGTFDYSPMVLDILAIQNHYGADSNTGAGNTTYSFTDSGLNGRRAVYDASGTDTFDLSALSRGSTVDLRPGAYSDFAYYSVAAQEEDLVATYGEGFRSFIHSNLNDPTRPAYEWERNVGIAFSTVIENVKGSAFVDTIIGNDAANLIDGNGGADRLHGLRGNDVYYVDNAGDRVFEAANGGTDTVSARVSYALQAGQSVETLSLAPAASTDALNLTGNELAQRLIGNAGANRLDGKGGADSHYGLGGNDLYYVDNAGDLVFEDAGAGADTVLASVSYALSAGQSVETLRFSDPAGTAALNLTGNDLNQTLIGNAGANLLDGKGGADLMSGQGGNDVYYVDNAGDVVLEAAGQGTDAVSARVSYTLRAGQSVETLSLAPSAGTTALNLTGNELGQNVAGNAGNNIIDGGRGADRLFGFGGNDSFLFSTSLGGGNVDRIVDFIAANDTIRLDQSIFTVLGLGTLTASAFKDIGDPGAVIDANDRILYNDDNGALYYDVNGSGAGGRYHFATLENKPATLTAADFFVVA